MISEHVRCGPKATKKKRQVNRADVTLMKLRFISAESWAPRGLYVKLNYGEILRETEAFVVGKEPTLRALFHPMPPPAC